MLLGNKCCSALLYSEMRICIPYKSWHACIYLCNLPLSYAPLCYSYLTIPYFYLYPCLMIKGMCKSWLHTISGSQNLNCYRKKYYKGLSEGSETDKCNTSSSGIYPLWAESLPLNSNSSIIIIISEWLSSHFCLFPVKFSLSHFLS